MHEHGYAVSASSKKEQHFKPGLLPILIFIILILAVCYGQLSAQAVWKKDLLRYIHSLAKSDGGYGWEDQPDSHLTPTFAVIGLLHDLDQLPADPQPLITFVRTHHPQFGVNGEGGPSGTEERDLVYQQIQGILWLNGNAGDFAAKVKGWQPQANKVSNFEEHGYPVFIQEMMTPVCRTLLHLPLEDIAAHYTSYITARRRANGSFNNAPAQNGGDGNILNTYWGIYALHLLHKDDQPDKTALAWIRSCQLKNGGFTYQPHPITSSNDDVAYTWAAVKALSLLSAAPADKQACIRYLLSLRNPDGGFGRQPGQPSSPMSTFYAVDALSALDAFAYADKAGLVQHPPVKTKMDFSGLKVYTVQFEAQGAGSPAEAVMLADSLHIQLWGAKNDHPGWIEAAQAIADEKKVPVTFFRADEPYGKYVHMPGLGTFSHILDYIAPAQASPPEIADSSSWREFRQTSVQTLLNAGGALIWQVSNNEPLSRMVLDETVRHGGYAGISTIHFGQNFLFWLPFLYQYRYQLPFVALQDAHGTEAWWWADQLAGYRTLFLAREPTYQAMMEALKNNWVVAVRHDSVNNYRTRMLGGAPGVQDFIRSKMQEWQWWSPATNEPERPWAAVTVLYPADSFEVARPDKGVNIRIRCWWNDALYVLKNPVVQLEQLSVDHATVKTEHITKEDRRGSLIDDYYLYRLPDVTAGDHVIEAVFRHLKNGQVKKITCLFHTKPQ